MGRFGLLFALAALVTACSSSPPPRWAPGGAPLVIKRAVWDRGDERVEITDDGVILEDGDMIFKIDRAGRVVDEDYEPVAILLPDGQVAGNDSVGLGRVGVTNASPPGYGAAWISILPNGTVVRFDSDGERASDGAWQGCNGPQMRTCTYVTHVLALRSYSRHGRSGPSFGVGVGVGIPIR